MENTVRVLLKFLPPLKYNINYNFWKQLVFCIPTVNNISGYFIGVA